MQTRRATILLSLPLLAALLAAGSGQAQAQRSTSSSAGTGNTGQSASSSVSSGQPRAENCGTPDEPRPCPPMPRTPLREFPTNR